VPSASPANRATAVLQLVLDNSLLLVMGAVAALVWANLDLDTYSHFTHGIHFAVNDIGMVFFFALATKEVYEATLPGGPLASPRQAAVPVFAAIGGMAVPASMYAIWVTVIDRPDLMRGWAIPCATDIAFSYLAARLIFRRGHPAIPFLLLLAIADDALGLIVLAIFYPSGPVSPVELALWLMPAMVVAWALRRSGVRSFWLYVLVPGLLAWVGLYRGGIHPALAMVPIVPFMPHEKSDLKLFGNRPVSGITTMNEFEHWWRLPVQIILLVFGLVNAGVPLASVGVTTWIIMMSLIAGKPLGILLTTLLSERIGFRRAPGLDYAGLLALGIAAGIGFTVALFFTTAAFPPGPTLDEAKMGALLSFAAFPLAVGVGKVLGVGRSG
jgi:NhaA family Na+:H+ antiporter